MNTAAEVDTTTTTTPIKQKRGRKSKVFLQQQQQKQAQILLLNENENDNDTEKMDLSDEEQSDLMKPNVAPPPQVAKKRGRKPKGGKIIEQVYPSAGIKEPKPNVILHLKCSLKDLQTDTLNSSVLESYNFDAGDLSFEVIQNTSTDNSLATSSNIIQGYDKNHLLRENFNGITITTTTNTIVENNTAENDFTPILNNDTKEIWKKLKQLEHNLHNNTIHDKKSACFWCTCDFENPQIYIPKYYLRGTYHVYGCFCSPECATAYLMKEQLDTSTRFERYHLINNIYGKIYGYQKNIKPSPNPYYVLDKYYGNLTIQEYRNLTRQDRLFLIVDKPLTRVLPELHDDNDEFIINHKIIPSNTYQVKRKISKKGNNINIFEPNNSN